jgi:hypothetical protein
MEINKYNLSRYIPKPIRREVRQRCHFGCVICAKAIGEYEHFDPEFKDANEHKAEGITFLCTEHHTQKTKGFFSKSYIEGRNNIPEAAQICARNLIPKSKEVIVKIGNSSFKKTEVILEIDNIKILEIKKPEDVGICPLISARFFNSMREEVLTIDENEMIFSNLNWDIEQKSNMFIIKENLVKTNLELSYMLGEVLEVNITKLDFVYGAIRIFIANDVIYKVLHNQHNCLVEIHSNLSFENCRAAIIINSNGSLILGEAIHYYDKHLNFISEPNSTSISLASSYKLPFEYFLKSKTEIVNFINKIKLTN